MWSGLVTGSGLIGLLLAVACSRTPPERQSPPEASTSPFREAAAERGLVFRCATGATGEHVYTEIMPGGVGLFDADGDGDLDVYLVDGGVSELPGAGGTDRLFLNDGAARFTDGTERSAVRRRAYGMGVAAADRDGDGASDLYLTSFGRDQTYRNLGDGRFEEDLSSDVADGWSTSASHFDLDRDGDLDLWVARYVRLDDNVHCIDPTDRLDYCAPSAFTSVHDVLLVNDGSGRLVDRSAEFGLTRFQGAGLGVVAEDFDLDGWIDLYVANDLEPNHLWRNVEGERFEELALVNGLAYDGHGSAQASMGVVCEDLDGDGWTDLFLTHVRDESNTFYRGLGAHAGFVDATGTTGMGPASRPATGFGVNALDVGFDGDLDLVIMNGGVQRTSNPPKSAVQHLLSPYVEHDVWMECDGSRYRPARQLGATATVSRGSATGDLDGDGDLDLVVNVSEEPARLFLNESEAAGPWAVFDVRDGAPAALGARLRLTRGDSSRIHTVRSDGSYLSTKDARWHVALPPGPEPLVLEVTWVGGATESFLVVGHDRVHVIRRGAGQ